MTFLALVWRVVMPSGPVLVVDADGHLVEHCALTGLVLDTSDDPDNAPADAADHCPLAMAGGFAMPPHVAPVAPPAIMGAAETVPFNHRIHNHAPLRASPPRGPPHSHA